MRILIVEDEPKLAAALKRGLEIKGYSVDWIDEGEKARTRILLYKNEYDLVLLDLMLPGISGDEICRDVRKAGITTRHTRSTFLIVALMITSQSHSPLTS